MTSPSIALKPSIGLGDDVKVVAHGYVGSTLVTDNNEPVIALTLYGTGTQPADLHSIADLVLTPTAAARLIDALAAGLQELEKIQPEVPASTSVELYRCSSCGAAFGIAGQSTGSDEDREADERFDEQVRHHGSGACVAVIA